MIDKKETMEAAIEKVVREILDCPRVEGRDLTQEDLDIASAVTNRLRIEGRSIGDISSEDIMARAVLAYRGVPAASVTKLCSACGQYHKAGDSWSCPSVPSMRTVLMDEKEYREYRQWRGAGNAKLYTESSDPFLDGEASDDLPSAKFSTPRKLADLEEVINTRTPVWDIGGSGDVRVKLDTDVNDKEWYVLTNVERGEPLTGLVPCWAFPHFNGAYDQFAYEPAQFCFKNLDQLLGAFPTDRAIWAYDKEEYARRLEMSKNGVPDPFLDDADLVEAPTKVIPMAFRRAFEEDENESHEKDTPNMNQKTKTSIIDDNVAMAYLMGVATKAAAQESFKAMAQGKLNGGATVSIESVKQEGPNLVFIFALWDTVHPNLHTAVTLSAQINHIETSDQEQLATHMQQWRLEQKPMNRAEVIDFLKKNQREDNKPQQ